jgi:hypothetical protein
VNWDAVGASGEWIGGLATIGTLFYLANQVRQSTRAARSSTYQAASAAITEWSLAMSSNPAQTDNFFAAVQDPDAVDDATRSQIGLQLNGLFRNYENLFYQWRQGAISNEVWDGWSRQMCALFWSPGVQRWWPIWRMYCQADFAAFLEGSTPQDGSLQVGMPEKTD